MSPTTTVYKCPDGTDFPVEWDDPDEEKFGWFWDQMHCPLPLTPLSSDIWRQIGEGFGRAFERMGMPGAPAWKTIHGYSFGRLAPFVDDPQFRGTLLQRDIANRGSRLLELWRSDYQPEVQIITGGIAALADEVVRRDPGDILDRLKAAIWRLGEIHMLATALAGQAGSDFINMCKTEFGAEGDLIASELVSGFRSRALDSANGLWDLALAAREFPAVEALLRAGSASDFLARLDGVEGGPEFRQRLDEYLDEFGRRNESFSELSLPTWLEEPRFPLLMVRRYIETRDDASPQALHDRVARRRQERLAEVTPKLSGDAEKWQAFQRLMKLGQERTILIEDHNFYIDQQGPAAGRRICLALGERLTREGRIDQPSDIFYLREEELRSPRAGGMQAQVRERRTERERWMRVLPPATIGTGAVMRPESMERFWGPVENEPAEAGTLKGIAGSAGEVRGTARLILSLDEIDRLSPGEILVTYATAPPWTPAFAIAGGIVTDIGGTLSHCAVVAREYGIPAVVGARRATATIEDGQLITVDGTNGIIRLEA